MANPITVITSIHYYPFCKPEDIGWQGDQKVSTSIMQRDGFTRIYYYGELFFIQAHWLVAYCIFRIYRLFRRHGQESILVKQVER